MSDVKEKEKTAKMDAGQPVEAVAKKKRRGVSNDTRATSRLKFDDLRDANKANGLFQGHIESVEVKTTNIGEESTGLPSFNGLAVPRLSILFASNHPAVSERRYINLEFLPAESNVETIPGGKNAWYVDRIMAYMKHILDVYLLKGKPMIEEQEDALTLPFEDFDDNGDYISVEPEVVINGWKIIFDNFVNIMNTGNNGKPVYVDASGKIVPVWMKLLRAQKVKGQWKNIVGGNRAGDLTFPTFVGEGVLEIYQTNKLPIIKIDSTKERIRPVAEEAKVPTMPGVPNMPGAPMGGVPAGFSAEAGGGIGDMPDFSGAASDLPF